MKHSNVGKKRNEELQAIQNKLCNLKFLISVIVPVYNVERYIERCIESIITQDYENIEIILVDDGSTDDSGNICDMYAQKDARIKVIHKENGGLSSARNLALDQMTGDYLFFVDSDDYIFPGILSTLMLSCVDCNADVACCGYTSGRELYYCDRRIEVLDNIEAAKRMFICDGIDANAVCKLYNKNLFQSIRYPLCVYEVVPVTYKVLLKAEKVVNTYQLGYFIEKRVGSITRSPFGSNNMLYIKMARNELHNVKENYPVLEKYAYTFYLNTIISMRECAEDDDRCKNTMEYTEISKLFLNKYSHIKQNKLLTKRKRLIAALIKFGIYKRIKMIYYWLNRTDKM